jgi:ATP-dependent protease ClpP protease subunit|nr:head maturation protease, ClpP-related [uncultured Selenomonas sp.]DAV19480.1 MAG TPA: Putative ATP dependent Clp protease [Caudoviricetes sp.]
MMEEFWKFKNNADGEAELLLYGEISDASWYGDEVTPKKFAEDLAACGGKDLTVRVNSPGGDVFAAQAIYNQLKAYTGKVTVKIDGMCASAATVIACAGETVIMPSNTIYMIHNPKSAMLGYYDAVQLGKVSDRLTTVKQTIVNVYMGRVGNTLSEVQVRHKMDAEEWMTADKAKEYGFVDEITDEIPIENRWEDNLLIVNSVSCKLDRFENVAELRAILPEKKKRSDTIMGMTTAEALAAIKNLLTGENKEVQTQEAQQDTPAQNAEDVRAAAVAEERARMAALDALKNGNPAVDSIVEAAKANGATAESVKPYIDAAANAPVTGVDTKHEEKMLASIRAILQDSKESNADGVRPTPQPSNGGEAAEKERNISDIVNFANRMRGVE